MQNRSVAEEVLGISCVDEDNALHKAYSTLVGLELSSQAFGAECARLEGYDLQNWDAIPPADQESIFTLRILRQIFEDRHIKFSNVLQHWPTYEACYKSLGGIASQDSGSRRVLQAGCFTPFSAAAFAALARDVYKAQPLTIDLTTSNGRQQHGDYVVTDALRLGIASNSVHLAQTDCLLNMLQVPNEGMISFQDQALHFFNELYRVVQPGRHIVLREIASGLDEDEHPTYPSEKSKARFEEFKAEVLTGLGRAGFRSVLMKPATEIPGVDYLFDPSRDFSQYETYERAAIVVVTASKPS